MSTEDKFMTKMRKHQLLRKEHPTQAALYDSLWGAGLGGTAAALAGLKSGEGAAKFRNRGLLGAGLGGLVAGALSSPENDAMPYVGMGVGGIGATLLQKYLAQKGIKI